MVGRIKPVLHKVDAQHALKTNVRASVTCLGLVGPITSHNAAQGTMSSIVLKNPSRRVGLRYCSP